MGLKLPSLGKKLWDQVNFLDSGRTFKNQTPTNNRSAVGQLTHNAVTNTAGNFVKPFANIGPAFIVEPGRSLVAQATGNKAAMQAAESRKYKALENSLPGYFAQQAQHIAAIPYDLSRQVAGDFTNNPVASSNAGADVLRNINATPVGQATNIVERNLADFGARRSNPTLTKEQQKAAASSALQEVGVDPGASLGKQLTDTALGVSQLRALTNKPKVASKDSTTTIHLPEKGVYAKLTEEQAAKLADEVKNVKSGSGDIVHLSSNTPALQRGAREVSQAEIAGLSKNAEATLGKPKVSLRLAEKLSPDRQIRKVTNTVEEGLNKAIYKASVSTNPITRATARLTQGISREAGTPKELLQAKRQLLKGEAEYGKIAGLDVTKLGEKLTPESRTRVWAALDPEQAGRLGKTANPKNFTPQEAAYHQQILKVVEPTTKGNLDRGLITPEQAANPSYLKRAYEPFEGVSNAKVEAATKQGLLKQYRGRKAVSEDLVEKAITDPSYLAGKKVAQSHQAWANVDYSNYLADNGYVFDRARPGTVQLPNSPLYGKAAGKYVAKNISDDFTGFQYTNATLNAFNDIITAYDHLGIRRGKKELLTVFNPAVRLGNQVSNRVFATINGLNPLEFEKNRLGVKGMIKRRDPVYIEAVKQGLTGSDITKADFTKRIAQYIDDPDILKESGNWFQKSYSQADDNSRIAAFKTHLDKGYSPNEAARLTQRGFQDYSSVGFFYDMAAKTPVVGNAFVRFAGDSLRIGKNTLIDHPLRSIALVQTYGAFNEAMSRLSGETPEDKATREGRFGAPKIPGTNISLTTQTPWGEVNVARMFPFYQLNDIQGGLSKFAPIQNSPLTIKDGNLEVNGAGLNDPLLGQAAQVLIDKDFRGKSIQDPDNTGQFTEELPQSQKNKNLVRFLATQNLPLGREGDAIISAQQGEKDVYGKKRSLGQALARAGGIKIEQFGPDQAKETRQTNQFFDEKAQLDKEIAALPKSDQEAYKRATGYYKLREQTDNEFQPGEKRYIKSPVYNFPEDKWKDYTTNPKLYDLMSAKKQKEAAAGKPLQPEFDTRLSTGFRNQLINNKSLAPGEDVEADERMYSNPEWDKYLAIKKEYTDKAKKYYPEKDGEFVDELVKHKTGDFPTKPAAKVAYDAAYAAYVEGKGPKPAFTDAVGAARDQYSEAKRRWTNTEREARGLPPIDRETWENKTFGFDGSPSASGYGYGSGKKDKTFGSLDPYKYAVSLNAGGGVAKPKISVKKAGAAPKVASKRSAPKVSIRKSNV
jgi:hypothetical protein